MTLRNIAIIAHVDHGKTTLVDKLLQQSGTYRDNQRQVERAMDSNDLERERGITILAKCTSVVWGDTHINIVDTPGHADFGGEVERILSMVDGVIVLVDAAEGPMPQTKFVVGKALKLGLKPIVAINKVDRSDARVTEVVNEVFDLFAALDATDEQLDFPILYGSGKNGWMSDKPDGDPSEGMKPLFELVLKHVHPPVVEEGPFRLLGTILEANPYLGRIITGRIASGSVKPNQAVKVLSRDGKLVEQGRISKILAFRGLERVPLDIAEAGDIVAIAGLTKGTVADTFCDPAVDTPIQAQAIDPPTVSMSFIVNNSPLAGTEGDKVTSRLIRDRLLREAEGNVALRVVESADKDAMEVSGRGELQLAILIENMRREGFELSVSRPRVVLTRDENGQLLEPVEEVVIDVDEEFSGVVVQKMSERKAEMIEMRPSGGNRLRLVFYAPTRGLIGYQGELMTDTKGTAIMNRLFHNYLPYRGEIQGRRNGVLISNDQGEAVAYAMFKLEDRGPMMIEPGWKVYKGMIVGEHTRDNDLEINVLKGKQLTNIRTTSKDEAVRLTPPIRMTLEKALAYIEDDELVEITPKSIRLRKRLLDPNERKRAEKSKQAVA
ncbi:translational GTPase TypA [Rhodopseudomonas palustris]|uniref:Large ribosomal subunit assembly factor BipA n=2 Tax=Rhodopseudomonas TaxID=1073 RepID=Q6NCR1_RHOPA|nr:translational GTPase TypA [Rhodopseudomonas palustris]ACE98972.1 GTP-binding protein TypA [Rhodopseudomonas palustris TIE-1]OPF93288.1 GTP-binding protein TypA [Rhodopseudomonas palustris]PPQ44722.1 translational GTPase TypA [Rhodopseudomonas palustris]QLH69622.1 translational GTPase TypA [Rhodopseudomonas palustris]QQM01907.1 GTP-binding protein TypA/BipA [Rhodopseudomonas palustris]